jgi:hypothetical protein
MYCFILPNVLFVGMNSNTMVKMMNSKAMSQNTVQKDVKMMQQCYEEKRKDRKAGKCLTSALSATLRYSKALMGKLENFAAINVSSKVIGQKKMKQFNADTRIIIMFPKF